MTWDIGLGQELRRAEIHERHSGSGQGGIAPLASTSHILAFSTSEGAKYGYDYDGWHEDGTYHYTGEGQVGDQQMLRGNAAILSHRTKNRTIRLFIEVGQTKTGGAIVRYEGGFVVAEDQPYYRADALDRELNMRSVIVFRLVPVDAVRAPQDAAPAPRQLEVDDVELENNLADEFDVPPSSNPVRAKRREAALVRRYKAWREAAGAKLGRKRIRLPLQSWPLYTDIYDYTLQELIEAKGSAARNDVRLALGQVQDYSRFVKHNSLAVLLPVHPGDDLIDLLSGRGVACIYEAKPGQFERVDPAP